LALAIPSRERLLLPRANGQRLRGRQPRVERARAQGKRLGRPTISLATAAAIRKALKKGDAGIRKIATMLGVGTGTVQRIKAEMSAAV
jgi:hypothetical protein